MVMRLPRRLRSLERGAETDDGADKGPRLVGKPATIIEWPGSQEKEAQGPGASKASARAEIRMKHYSGIRDVELTEFAGRVASANATPAALLQELLVLVTTSGELSNPVSDDDRFVLEVRLVG